MHRRLGASADISVFFFFLFTAWRVHRLREASCSSGVEFNFLSTLSLKQHHSRKPPAWPVEGRSRNIPFHAPRASIHMSSARGLLRVYRICVSICSLSGLAPQRVVGPRTRAQHWRHLVWAEMRYCAADLSVAVTTDPERVRTLPP